MAEYISKEAVLKAFKLTAKNPNKDYQRGMQDTIDCLVPEVIADIPAADVQPVKRGKWIISNIYAHCSECSVAYDLDTFQRLIPMHENVPRHCSYCGARMDE